MGMIAGLVCGFIARKRFDDSVIGREFILTDAVFGKMKSSTTEGQIAHHSGRIALPLDEKPPPQARLFIQIFHAEGAKNFAENGEIRKTAYCCCPLPLMYPHAS